MHIWTIENWRKHLNYDKYTYRTGLRLRFEKDTHPEIKRACKEFCKWLRSEYYFPVRIPIYIKKARYIKALDGGLVAATIFLPDSLEDEPYARVSTGEYDKMLKYNGQDNALASILSSIAHELTHYYQWINGIELTEIGIERQATMYARYIIDEYSETREHP